MAETTFDINTLTHPYYNQRFNYWMKWRLTYEGGDLFIRQYLERFSKTEDDDDFKTRQKYTYCPAFAKAAVIEVKNSIYQRMTDITRVGGSNSYQEAVVGLNNGVDLLGSTMNVFMGTEVLPELLSMGRVGVYVDMPPKLGSTIIDNIDIRPYVYIYKTEDIRAWDFDESPNSNLFKSVLLRDYVYVYDEVTHLPINEIEVYRLYYTYDNQVFVKFYNSESLPTDQNGNQLDIELPILLEGLTRIPFIVLELNESLLTDIANYQIALLNLASADMAYAIGANFPFYTEQYDPRYASGHLKKNDQEQSEMIEVGPASGRRYPIGTERPGFIFPSSEPMIASMDKQEQLKREIRLLINLAISNIQPKMASAESKGMDERTLESGLSYIGLILEDAERQIATIWDMYEKRNRIATINYPEKYDLRTDESRRKEAEDLRKLLGDVPSKTYQIEIAKQIAYIMLGTKVTYDTMKAIISEIESAEVVNVIPDQINKDLDAGLVDPETASLARGYPEGSVEAAQEFQAKRLALIQAAQTVPNTAARGNPDASVDPAQQAKLEKTNQPGRGAASGNGSSN